MDPFVEQHRPRWERLAGLLSAIDAGGLRSLSPTELEEFGRLYRQASAHLAQARAERRDPRLIEHLNLLVGRAHAIIYARSRRRPLRPLAFYTTEFPQLFRRTCRFTAVSAAIFIGSAVFAYLLVINDPGWLVYVAPSGLSDAIESFLKRNVPAGTYFGEAHEALGGGPLSALLWTHNLQIGLVAFALGIGLGIGTVWALSSNGMMVGSVIAVGAVHHKVALVCAVMAPHGVIELSAIMISGGAGLMLGYAVINPGDLTRRDAIVLAARDAIKLMLGVVPMFLAAGLIEGTLSPIATGLFRTNFSRLAFGAATGVLLLGYLTLGDRMFAPWSRFRRRAASAARMLTPVVVPSARDTD